MARLVPLALCLSLAGGAAFAAPLPAVPANPAIHQVADDDSNYNFQATKHRYVEQARDQMAEWRHRMDSVADRAGSAAHYDLERAWQRAKLEEYRLESATENGWKSAKNSFDEASETLKDKWNSLSR